MTIRQDKRLEQFLNDKHFKDDTEIQKQAFSTIVKGKDIIAISKTGTGKTLAYLMPLFKRIQPEDGRIQALILSPTQELSQQIFSVAKELQMYFPEIRIMRVTKGEDRKKFEKSNNNQPHIIIGTVGKLSSLFVEESTLRLDLATILVIDEADMMLDPRNLEEIDAIAGKMDKHLQMLVFSATIPDNMNAFMRSYMHQPKLVKIDEDLKFDPNIEHILIPFKSDDHLKVLQLLPHINPALCLIFVNHQSQIESLSTKFDEEGIRHLVIHGKMSARERNQVLRQIQEGQYTYIISTDVAARGLDLEQVTDVISLGIPNDLSFYTHRAGRTGRAGKSGRAFAFYFDKDVNKVLQLIKNGIKFNHKALNKTGLRELKPIDYKHQHKASPLDIEIATIVKNRPKKVKPGYKKKITIEIEQLKRKKKRQMIQNSIKEQQKFKSKMKQIEKGKQE